MAKKPTTDKAPDQPSGLEIETVKVYARKRPPSAAKSPPDATTELMSRVRALGAKYRPTMAKARAERAEADSRYVRLSSFQKRLLVTLCVRESLTTAEVAILSAFEPEDYTEASRDQQKIYRNTARKTMEKLADRGLVELYDTPNLVKRRSRSGEVSWGVFGETKAVRIVPEHKGEVASLFRSVPLLPVDRLPKVLVASGDTKAASSDAVDPSGDR